MSDLDVRVRLHIYETLLDRGAAPTVAESAAALGVGDEDARGALRRLAAGRAIVLRPGTDDVLMAPPLSAVPTRFRVEAAGRSHWANCIWDALGVAAMLESDARIEARCGDCDETLELRVEDGRVHGDGVVHFGLPARRWWEDIVFT